jgi:hypothetical protein
MDGGHRRDHVADGGRSSRHRFSSVSGGFEALLQRVLDVLDGHGLRLPDGRDRAAPLFRLPLRPLARGLCGLSK